MTTPKAFVHLTGCLMLSVVVSGCANAPHRDASRGSAALDVSAPAILAYRPLSEGGELFMDRYRASRSRPADPLLVRGRGGKQMAAYDDDQWAGRAP